MLAHKVWLSPGHSQESGEDSRGRNGSSPDGPQFEHETWCKSFAAGLATVALIGVVGFIHFWFGGG